MTWVRSVLAALDINMSSTKTIATTKDGQQRDAGVYFSLIQSTYLLMDSLSFQLLK